MADIVPRICGICPVAYQMSAIHGLERLFEVQVPEGTHELRRLLYCAEWIESHMLHVHLLAAPDFLGFDSAIEMAQHGLKAEVERGLKIKRLGNDLLASIGGREIHPVSPMVGGFSKAPRRARPPRARGAVRGRARPDPRRGRLGRRRSTYPDLPASGGARVDGQPRGVPDERGRHGLDVAAAAGTRPVYEDETREIQVEHSNALHSVFADTGTAVLPAGRSRGST